MTGARKGLSNRRIIAFGALALVAGLLLLSRFDFSASVRTVVVINNTGQQLDKLSLNGSRFDREKGYFVWNFNIPFGSLRNGGRRKIAYPDDSATSYSLYVQDGTLTGKYMNDVSFPEIRVAAGVKSVRVRLKPGKKIEVEPVEG